jgi:integrase
VRSEVEAEHRQAIAPFVIEERSGFHIGREAARAPQRHRARLRARRSQAGIEGVTFHSMRHAFASRMIARGISSTVLAALLGHESSSITERRYIHLFDR